MWDYDISVRAWRCLAMWCGSVLVVFSSPPVGRLTQSSWHPRCHPYTQCAQIGWVGMPRLSQWVSVALFASEHHRNDDASQKWWWWWSFTKQNQRLNGYVNDLSYSNAAWSTAVINSGKPSPLAAETPTVWKQPSLLQQNQIYQRIQCTINKPTIK